MSTLEEHVSFILTGMLIILFVLLFFLEKIFPLRKQKSIFIKRLFVNGGFSILVYFIAFLFLKPVVFYSLGIVELKHFGLSYWLSLPRFLTVIILFLCMDLSFYYWHRLNHQIPILWRFHNVHHTDPDLDVTTAMRFHGIEILYSSVFRLIQILLIGVTPGVYILYEFFFQTFTYFHHANLKLPKKFERIMNYIFVTPRMHGIHHSNYQSETNQNYGVIFSFWDRLHNTLTLNIAQKNITIGVFAYGKPKDNQFLKLLLMPFKKQRKYWQVDAIKHYQRDGK